MAQILFVMTAADYYTLKDGTKHPSGFWGDEFTKPFEVFTHAGHAVTVATPGGVVPTVDKGSLTPEANGGAELAADVAQAIEHNVPLHNPIRLEDVKAEDWDAVFYPGGHGPMEDLSTNADSAALLVATLKSGKPLGLVCHGPAALLATAGPDGKSPFTGARLTAFSDMEEEMVGLAAKSPWLLEDRLIDMGCAYRSGQPFTPFIITDDNLYTGQNPASAGPTAEEMIKGLALPR
ncbi:type 1 glutamine amidotransferase domain-containing protein [Nocardia camponoti]|uniref:Dimethylallyltransferase n=1 Tax=Nocardia camponoti TaxID=1616106 RepID=A0A917QDG9_9NOCA|nr:type 1 glutamine amidotransferase domain-containing protein [Nocardia camponoti]GGK46151.1 dimethylallyltransferase [Nocardia camponoti]